jgi:hypothetical protein
VTSCQECGFDYESVPVGDVAGRLRSYGSRYGEALAGVPDEVAARRPAPGVWSALEYACHVRDLLFVQRDRTVLALVQDCPQFPRMYRDERVDICAYGAQPAGTVAGQLGVGAELLALVFDHLRPDELERPLLYNFPDPTERDVAWMGRHTVHECEHHLGDVRGVLGRAGGVR